MRGHILYSGPGVKAVAGNTIQDCFDNASDTAKVIGIRTDNNSCWEYGDGYEDYIKTEEALLNRARRVMVCRDPTKDIMKKEC